MATLRQILMIYEASGAAEATTATAARIEEQIARDNAIKRKRARANRGSASARTGVVRKVKKPVSGARTGVKTRA